MNILFLDACISTHESRTKLLCKEYLRRCTEAGHTVTTVNLAQAGLQPLDEAALRERDALVGAGAFDHTMFALARQFQTADRIVLGAPYWDLSFPAVVKLYVEQIMVCGLTFHYVDNASEGLCHADKLVYITSAGGFTGDQDFGYTYMKAIAQMLGIKVTERICAEGLDIFGTDVNAILEETIAQFPVI